MPVVGESFYQENLRSIVGLTVEDGDVEDVEAVLVLEDVNPHDKNAVRIDVCGLTVGYLSRENAKSYRKKLKDVGLPEINLKCEAEIRCGEDENGVVRMGVWLDIPVVEQA
jgi:hypothetical protein